MTDQDLWAAWRLSMAVAGVIVLVAASLLVAIWLTARRILAHAGRALAAAEKIRRHTLPIWELETTNEVAGRLLETARAIEGKGGALVQAVSQAEGGGRSPAAAP